MRRADHPQAMLEILAAERGLTGATRANLMARADPADPRQLDAVDTYLKSPDLTDAEAAAFLNSFPLRSRRHLRASRRTVTSSSGPQGLPMGSNSSTRSIARGRSISCC